MALATKRETCRLCDSRNIDRIYTMPACPPVDNFRLPGEPEITLPKFAMDLYQCASCGHAQLLDVVDPHVLFGKYIYTSSSSTDLERHFSTYAQRVIDFLPLRTGTKVLDIGSNDGLLLTKFRERGVDVYGIDPSSYAASKAAEHGVETMVAFFNEESMRRLIDTFTSFDLVTANNVFSHADDLRGFANCVREVLSENGVFVFEVSYLKDLVDNIVIDYVYHEHLCHHSVKPLKQFLNSCGLKLVHVDRIKTKGGSIRCFAVKTQHPMQPEAIVDQMIAEEVVSGLYDPATYKKIYQTIEALSQDLRNTLSEITRNGGMIASYGASATSTVLNSLLKIDEFISFVVDDNELRQKRLSPGFMVPVLPSEALIAHQPACVVISAWRFADELVQRNNTYLSQGGRFIVPLPSIREITYEYR